MRTAILTKKEQTVFDAITEVAIRSDDNNSFLYYDVYEKLKGVFTKNQIKGCLGSLRKKWYILPISDEYAHYNDAEIVRERSNLTYDEYTIFQIIKLIAKKSHDKRHFHIQDVYSEFHGVIRHEVIERCLDTLQRKGYINIAVMPLQTDNGEVVFYNGTIK